MAQRNTRIAMNLKSLVLVFTIITNGVGAATLTAEKADQAVLASGAKKKKRTMRTEKRSITAEGSQVADVELHANGNLDHGKQNVEMERAAAAILDAQGGHEVTSQSALSEAVLASDAKKKRTMRTEKQSITAKGSQADHAAEEDDVFDGMLAEAGDPCTAKIAYARSSETYEGKTYDKFVAGNALEFGADKVYALSQSQARDHLGRPNLGFGVVLVIQPASGSKRVIFIAGSSSGEHRHPQDLRFDCEQHMVSMRTQDGTSSWHEGRITVEVNPMPSFMCSCQPTTTTTTTTTVCADLPPHYQPCTTYTSRRRQSFYCDMGKSGTVRRRGWGGDAKDNCPLTCGYCEAVPEDYGDHKCCIKVRKNGEELYKLLDFEDLMYSYTKKRSYVTASQCTTAYQMQIGSTKKEMPLWFPHGVWMGMSPDATCDLQNEWSSTNPPTFR